jgi:hypothetical protein
MIKYLFASLLATISLSGSAQNVGVGTITPNAKLEITASNVATPTNQDGILIPRVNTFPAANPGGNQNGMMIYLNTTVGANLPGFYYWINGTTSWKPVGDGKFWSLTGNAGTNPATHFFGTTDNQDLIFKRNNLRGGLLSLINTSWGIEALNPSTTGTGNTANGYQALFSNTSGNNNVANGDQALRANTTGYYNTANGYASLYSNTTGINNVANGYQALFSNTTGAGNVANGFEALFLNTTGINNTANGYQALRSNTISNNNVANGYQALFSNTTGEDNSAIGFEALFSNTTGFSNTADGSRALHANTSGNKNTANGVEALFSNTSGFSNTANGHQALNSNTTGNYNTANGHQALFSNTIGVGNTANGHQALGYNTTGYNNVANGAQSLYNNSIGFYNSAMGELSLYNNTEGNSNSAVGRAALYTNNLGNYNVAHGRDALYSNTSGTNNIAIGFQSLIGNTTGNNNTGLGTNSGNNNSTGSGNVFIGYQAGYNETGSNKLYIANSTGNSNAALVYGDFGSSKLQVNNMMGIGLSPASSPLEIKALGGFAELIKFYNNGGSAKWHIRMDGDDLGFTETTVADNRLVLRIGGEVGIGKLPLTTNNDSRLQVKQKGSQNGLGIENANTTDHWDFYVTAAPSDMQLYLNGVHKGTFAGTNGAYTLASDRRLKKDISAHMPVMNGLAQLQAYQYHYLDNKPTDNFSNGFMAQDVLKLFPDAVIENEMKNGEKRLGINYQYFTVVAIKAIQEQQKIIDTQEERLKKLEAQVQLLLDKK